MAEAAPSEPGASSARAPFIMPDGRRPLAFLDSQELRPSGGGTRGGQRRRPGAIKQPKDGWTKPLPKAVTAAAAAGDDLCTDAERVRRGRMRGPLCWLPALRRCSHVWSACPCLPPGRDVCVVPRWPAQAAAMAERQAPARHGRLAFGRRHGVPVQAGAIWRAAHQPLGARSAAGARCALGPLPLPRHGQAGARAAGARGRRSGGSHTPRWCAQRQACLAWAHVLPHNAPPCAEVGGPRARAAGGSGRHQQPGSRRAGGLGGGQLQGAAGHEARRALAGAGH